MAHLEGVTQKMLQDALEQVEGKRAIKRLTAAIAYKKGVTQTELAEWYGVEKRTISNWLNRIDESGLTDSVADLSRSDHSKPTGLDSGSRGNYYPLNWK